MWFSINITKCATKKSLHYKHFMNQDASDFRCMCLYTLHLIRVYLLQHDGTSLCILNELMLEVKLKQEKL